MKISRVISRRADEESGNVITDAMSWKELYDIYSFTNDSGYRYIILDSSSDISSFGFEVELSRVSNELKDEILNDLLKARLVHYQKEYAKYQSKRYRYFKWHHDIGQYYLYVRLK